MDEMARTVETPEAPPRCPRCGKKIVISGEHIRCNDCGELYYDEWLGIWRIQRPKED